MSVVCSPQAPSPSNCRRRRQENLYTRLNSYRIDGKFDTIDVTTFCRYSPILGNKEEIVANKEQKKVQKAAPKSNKQKKEMLKEKKASKQGGTGISLKKE